MQLGVQCGVGACMRGGGGVLGVRGTWRQLRGRMRGGDTDGGVIQGVRRREPCGRGRMQRIMPDRVRMGMRGERFKWRGRVLCIRRRGKVAGRGGGVRRREYRERRRVLIIVHDRGGVLVRALCGAAVSMRSDWGLVHAGVRGRACGGEGGMGGGVLRRREPGVARRVLERLPGGVRVHVRAGQGHMRDGMRGRAGSWIRGVRRRELGGRGRMQLDV